MFKPSKFQKTIFDTYRTTNKNIVVDAVPGSGKTTTILKLMDMVPPAKDAIYCAFNKSIVTEIRSKIPKFKQRNVKVSTLHGIGLSTIRTNFPQVEVEITPFKNLIIFQKLNQTKWQIPDKKLMLAAFVSDALINHYKLNLSTDYKDLVKLGMKYNVDFTDEDLQRTVEMLEYLEIYDKFGGPSKKKMLSFADMLYLPIKYDMKTKKYHEVFIDECQDLNIAQQMLVKKILKPGGRFVAVGDKNQCIYSFIGADPKSFDNFISEKNTVSLPLSVTYRCKKNIADFANNIYNTMEAHEEGGVVREGSINEIRESDFVLCRNNAPLVEIYINLLGKRIKSYIKGKDLGDELIHLLKPVESDAEIKSYFAYSLQKLEEYLKSKGVREPKNSGKYRHMVEKMTIINHLIKVYPNLDELRKVLVEMFTDDQREGVCLSTIHKAKGLETNNVFILSPHLIPSSYAEKPWEIEQEENLKFVAFSRAKDSLIFINDFCMPTEKPKEVEEEAA